MGWGARLGSATEEAASQPLPAARPPPAASQQVIARLRWTPGSSAAREGEQRYQLGRPAADLQPGPAPPAHLPATTRRAD